MSSQPKVPEIIKPKGKLLAGLTGTFGSGKSTAAGFFIEFGACVIDADALAREALQISERPYALLVKSWGADYLTSQREVDRRKVADLVFRDSEKRRELESWIHPYVFERMNIEISRAASTVVILEVPLLFETELDKSCDRTITVTAPQAMMEERLVKQGFTLEAVRQRQLAQMSLVEKVKQSDFVIHNDSTIEAARVQTQQVWNQLNLEASKI